MPPKKTFVTLTVVGSLFGLGCDRRPEPQRGPLEQTGHDVDREARPVGHEIDDTVDEAAQDVDENVDER